MYLEKIDSPEDVRLLSVEQLKTLCAEIRQYIIDCCSSNPGHLASSLGAVELIVGIHYVFDTPDDKVVFDVGHQAYAHKIMTGRKEIFKKNRTLEGISGFPKMSESIYDAFGVGHSSTSISAALGLAEAARMEGKESKTIAFIGDGALTGGLAFEALNNAGNSHADLLIILNDNNQSIDDNLGGLHNNLLRITTGSFYNQVKGRVWNTLGDTRFRSFIQRWVRSFKSWTVKKMGGDLFETLGLRYFGPIDGHDIVQVVDTLRKLKDLHGPRIIHCITTKGKGYAPAEADPVVWHAPGRFNPVTGERITTQHKADRYQDVFGEVLCQLAEMDKRVVGITPAMASGCGMNLLAEKMPERFFDVGIEEQHAVTFAAGLAAGGMKPFCNIYSTFSQRAYDQIVHDVALQKLPVTLCLDRAGLVGEDGATHQGAFDLAAYRSIPDTIISAPKDEIELKRLMYTALEHEHGPFIIRYPRGMGEGTDWRNAGFEVLEMGKAEILMTGSDVAVIAIGPVVNRAMQAAASFGGRVGVYNFRFLKPLDEDMLKEIAESGARILTLEDGSLKGGLFSAVSEFLSLHGYSNDILCCGIPDRFIEQDRQDNQRKSCNLDVTGIREKLSILLQK